MHNFKQTAVIAAKEAGRALKENLGKNHIIEMKGALDIVTEMDMYVEDLIIKRLRMRL